MPSERPVHQSDALLSVFLIVMCALNGARPLRISINIPTEGFDLSLQWPPPFRIARRIAVAAAMRGLVLDGDKMFVFLFALSVDRCDALMPDVDYVLLPGRLLIAEEALRRGCTTVATPTPSRSSASSKHRTRPSIVCPDDNRGPGTVLRRSGRCCDAEGGHCDDGSLEKIRALVWYFLR